MTVSNTTLRNQYQGNGVQTEFQLTIAALTEANQSGGSFTTIEVIITDANGVETVKTEDVDYTVALNADRTGTVTFTTAPASTETITFLSKIPQTQTTDYINIGTGKFPADSHEGTVDKLTLISQELQEKIDRSILLPSSSTLTNVNIPVSVANANKAIVVNSTGDNLDAQSLIDINLFPVTSFAEGLLQDNNAAESRQTTGSQEDVVTTRGDLVRGSASNVAERLPLGTNDRDWETD